MNIKHNIVRYLYGLFLGIASYIIPKNKDLYIFGSINSKTFSGNSKAMFLYYLKNDKSKKVFYVIDNKKLIYNFEKTYTFLKGKLIYKYSLKNIINVLRAKYIFTDSDMYDVSPGLSYQFGKFNVINLFHGEGPKLVGYLGNTEYTKGGGGFIKKLFKNYFNNVVKLGCNSSEFFQDLFNRGHLTNKYKITGLPRNDVFFRNDLEIFGIKNKFNLDKYNKTILYVPTWRQDSKKIQPFSEEFLNKLNKYLKQNNYIFLIKAHQNTDKILNKEYSNIKDISKEVFDVQELLKYTDVMITDYSSIFVDYMLLDRPILFYAYDYEYYKNKLVNLIDDYQNIVPKKGICYDENQLFELIKKSDTLFNDKEYKEQFLKLKNKYHKYQNGGYIKNLLKKI